MVDVRGNDRAAAGNFVADEFGRDVFGNRSAEGLAAVLVKKGIAWGLFRSLADGTSAFPAIRSVLRRNAGRDARAPAEVFTNRNEFHFGRDDAAPGVMHLRHTRSFLCAQRRAAQCWKIL